MKQPRPPVPSPAHRSPLVPALIVGAAFVLSRIGYHIAGVRFDASSLPWFWQYVDPALLRSDFLSSIWNLHSQPPLANVFLGLILAFPSSATSSICAVMYLLLGLALAAGLLLLLRGVGLPDALSAAVTAIYVASPACVLYENWLFYTYPVAVMIVLAALFFHRFVSTGRARDALAFFGIAAALSLTWSLFHITWLLLLVSATLLARRDRWRQVLVTASVPLLVVTLWYGKNLAQVGQFTSSTWFGMNFSKMTNSMLTVPERRALYDEGAIGAVSMVPPFSNPDRYIDAPVPATVGIPALDQRMKPSGVPNFNNRLYIDVSSRYGRDALTVLRRKPVAYLRGLAESFLLYFQPSSAYLFLAGNLRRVEPVDRLFTTVFNGRFFYHQDRSLRRTDTARYYAEGLMNTGWFVILGYLAALAAGVMLLLSRKPSPMRATLLFLWFNILWVTVVANALEVGENNRFRFVTDPLVVTLLAAIIFRAVANRRSRNLTAPQRRAS